MKISSLAVCLSLFALPATLLGQATPSPAPSPVVRMTTSLGTIDIQLVPASAPNTVTNFLHYMDRPTDGYNGTFFHRSVPGFVVQGGGFITKSFADLPTSIFAVHIHTDPPVANEFSLSNVRGTVGMAKLSGNPNSATCEWFFNLADNSANLDHTNGGFTVFGRVIGNGMSVADAIAALPRLHNQSGGVPLHDFTPGSTATPQNLVNTLINRITPMAARTDFNLDHKSDIVLQNTATGQRSVWIMNGTALSRGVNLLSTALAWTIVGTGDFNGDGATDIVLENTSTGRVAAWLMNGTAFSSGVNLPSLPVNWHIGAVGDLNGDGKPDFILQNASTGQCAVWFMSGLARTSSSYLPTIPLPWKIAGTADINLDGKLDIVFQNVSAGTVSVWLMNGSTFITSVPLPSLPANWKIGAINDFNGDGNPDLILQNSSTGQRRILLMSGALLTTSVDLPTVPIAWDIRN